MYRIYVIQPTEVVYSITVFSKREAESICIEAMNKCHYDDLLTGRIMTFHKIEINPKMVDGINVSDSAFEVLEHIGIRSYMIAEFESPIDAMQFMNQKINFQWYTRHDNVLILKMVHSVRS